MRAAVVRQYGVPVADEFAEPAAGGDQAVVDVLAAGVNPVDVAICAGRYYAGRPPLPFVAGREGVGLLDGERVYFDAPLLPFGSMAQRTLVDRGSTYPVLDALADGMAIALGIAGLAGWLAVTWRAGLQPGEHVLVLAASGVVGQVAVQAAKLLGAGRVVAAARSEQGLRRSLELGADATVALDTQPDLAAALSDAAGGRLDVVIDPLFGEPFAAAVQAASTGARLVQLGAGASDQATLSSAAIRGKLLEIKGHTNILAPETVKRDAYRRMSEVAAVGGLRIDVEELALEQVQDAWDRLSDGSHRKIVLRPPPTGGHA